MTGQQQRVYKFLAKKILNYQKHGPVIVGINGKDGSGKTMMADNLSKFLSKQTDREIIRISIDDFMNSRSVRYTPAESPGRGCYEYTFDIQGFLSNVLMPLQPGGSWKYRKKIFDHASDSADLGPIQESSETAIVIIDGVFLYKKELLNYWDIKVMLRTDDDVVIERGAKRDTARLGSYEVARQKYIDRYIASQAIYYKEEEPERRADIIIDNNDVRNRSVI